MKRLLQVVHRSCAALLLPALACHSAAQAPRPSAAPKAVVATTAPPIAREPEVALSAPDLGDPTQQFLVHSASQEIVLRSMTSEATRVLVAHADAALYQPALELVWFRDSERFGAVDLRKRDAPVIPIARGMPNEHRLWITRGMEIADPNDGCDLPYISLEWTESPLLTPILTEAPDLRIDNGAWLAAELERPARPVARKQGFFGAKIRVPKRLFDCEDPADCGKSAPFSGGKQLVLIQDRLGGDCIQRACMLYDPSTRLFATPPKAETWGSAKTTKPGTCGPFLFDRTKTWFLVDRRLCALGQGCKDLGADALGWLVPGESVGSPGTGDFPE